MSLDRVNMAIPLLVLAPVAAVSGVLLTDTVGNASWLVFPLAVGLIAAVMNLRHGVVAGAAVGLVTTLISMFLLLPALLLVLLIWAHFV